MRLDIISPLAEVDSEYKAKKILWNNRLDVALVELNYMVSEETFLNYMDW